MDTFLAALERCRVFFLSPNTCEWADDVLGGSSEEPQEKGAGARRAGAKVGSSATASGLDS